MEWNEEHPHWHDTYDWAGLIIQEWIGREYDPATTTILDVGAGQGKYGRLLSNFTNVDACEVWKPYVEENNLRELYREVYVCEIETLCLAGRHYDVVIMGDVLEHLTVEDAQDTLTELQEDCDDIIVVVPYQYEQGPEHGNHYQRHLQADLTHALMFDRYPQLRLMTVEYRSKRPFKGIYRWRSE